MMSYENDECKLLIDEALHDYLHDDTYPRWHNETYKTMDYVERCLKETVDVLSEYKGVDINENQSN